MKIKFEKIISCTSEHPSYPASNLLSERYDTSWRCAKPGEMLASVIFQLAEPSCITGVDIGNYRSCVVVVTASTSLAPDDWIPIVQHQFMTHDDAANSRFRDQVQLFTKKEIDVQTLGIKFDRVKVTCMQSANPRELFGLIFIVLKTEVTLELNPKIAGRFKLKDSEPTIDDFKEKYLKLFPNKRDTYKDVLAQQIKEKGAITFAKRQEDGSEPMKRPILEKLEGGARLEDIISKKNGKESPVANQEKKKTDTPKPSTSRDKDSTPVPRTPFGDVITPKPNKVDKENKITKKRLLNYEDKTDKKTAENKHKNKCTKCTNDCEDQLCKTCKELRPQKPFDISQPLPKKPKIIAKPKKQFSKLFEGMTFALSGYVNPQREEIRQKVLKMGGKYIVDPNTTNNKCSFLICAFKNTPKSQQLKGHTKIVSHKFIEQCYEKKTRFPWRRFALDRKEKEESESEEEIEGTTLPDPPPDPYNMDTDSD